MKSHPSRARSRAALRTLVRIPGCLALACGLMLGAAGGSAASDTVSAGTPHVHLVPVPPGPDDRGPTSLTGSVTPVDTEVARDENGDFTLTVVNTGTVTAHEVRVLLDGQEDGNAVGSPDGRCVGRLDATSPADLWCELGDVAPRQTAAVEVHAYMSRCVWTDPGTPAPRLHAAAFHWRADYTDRGRAQTSNGPTPRWSCGNGLYRAHLDSDPAARRP